MLTGLEGTGLVAQVKLAACAATASPRVRTKSTQIDGRPPPPFACTRARMRRKSHREDTLDLARGSPVARARTLRAKQVDPSCRRACVGSRSSAEPGPGRPRAGGAPGQTATVLPRTAKPSVAGRRSPVRERQCRRPLPVCVHASVGSSVGLGGGRRDAGGQGCSGADCEDLARCIRMLTRSTGPSSGAQPARETDRRRRTDTTPAPPAPAQPSSRQSFTRSTLTLPPATSCHSPPSALPRMSPDCPPEPLARPGHPRLPPSLYNISASSPSLPSPSRPGPLRTRPPRLTARPPCATHLRATDRQVRATSPGFGARLGPQPTPPASSRRIAPAGSLQEPRSSTLTRPRPLPVFATPLAAKTPSASRRRPTRSTPAPAQAAATPPTARRRRRRTGRRPRR